jgi:hypothetical protein
MSMTTSTRPRLLNTFTLPSPDSFTVTEFATGACPALKFIFDAYGRSASAGNTVRYEPADGSTTVTFAEIPVAVLGMEQFPLVPHTVNGTVSPAPTGV